MSSVAPQALALVVCDAVHEDPATGKRTLLGLFNGLTSRSFPVTHPSIAVYAAITEGYGEYAVKLKITDGDARAVLYESGTVIRFGDPRTVAEISFTFLRLRFPTAGEYRIQLHVGEHFLSERRLVVRQA